MCKFVNAFLELLTREYYPFFFCNKFAHLHICIFANCYLAAVINIFLNSIGP